jgi:hypothetical protein
MKLTKDESRILSAAVGDFKFRSTLSGHMPDGLFDKLEDLENRLEKFGKDKRRTGRTSQDDYDDLLKRFSK